MLMHSVALVSLAAALLCWPDLRARTRLSGAGKYPFRLAAPVLFRGVRIGAVPAILAFGAATAGIAGFCAATVLLMFSAWYWRTKQASRRRWDSEAELAAGLRLLVAELRAGSHPATAAEGAAVDAGPRAARVFRAMAVSLRLGGEVRSVLYGHAVNTSGLPGLNGIWGPLARMGRAWELADQYGVALADLLDSVRRDVEHRVAFVRDLEAKMAGPRSTAGVLAGLPLLGLLLGEAAGSAPLAVLTEQLAGQILLMVGVGLLCLGVFWTVRLTETAVRT